MNCPSVLDDGVTHSGYDAYMTIVGIFGQSLFFLQALKIWKNKSAKDVSLLGFGIATLSLLSWLVFGLLHRSRVVVVVNAVGLAGAFLVCLASIWVTKTTTDAQQFRQSVH